MPGTIFHLIDTPGVGKYTIGVELARLTGARLVDNHSIANVLFNLIEVDGVTPLPQGIWPRYAQVRAVVLDTLVHVSPPHLSFVFTNYVNGSSEDHEVFLEMAAVAEARGSTFVPVILRCDTTELRRRIAGPDRRARMKLTDPAEGARLNDHVPRFHTDHPNVLELDVSRLAPSTAATTIARWAAAIAARSSIEQGKPNV